MSRTATLAAVSFGVALAIAVVAASAVRTDATEIAIPTPGPTVAVPVAGGGSVAVEEASLDITSDDPAADPDTRPDPPPRGEAAPVPEEPGSGGNAIDAALAEAEEEMAALDLRILGAPLDLAPVGGFVDLCLEAPDDCPFGLGAIVLDPVEAAGPALNVVATYAAADDEDDLDHCQAEFTPDAHNLIVYSSNPVAITATYGITAEGIEMSVSDPGPQPSHPVYTRWEGLVDSGELAALPPIDQVVWCATLPGVEESTGRAAGWNVWDITGTDPFGQADTVPWWIFFEVGRTDWPPAVMGFGPELRLRVGVWERTGADATHRGLAWPVDHTDPTAESCTEVEARLVTSRDPAVARFFWDHPEMNYNFAPVTLDEEARPAPLYRGEWDLRAFAMPLREGRTYTICLWELQRGDRSFDTWEVVNRETRQVVTPNLHNVAVSGSVNLRQDPAGPVSFGALVQGPTLPCRYYSHGGSTGEISEAGAYSLRGGNDPAVLCQSEGLGYDDLVVVTPIVTTQSGQFYGEPHAITLDVHEGCDFSAEGPGCVGGRSEAHDFEFTGCDECPPGSPSSSPTCHRPVEVSVNSGSVTSATSNLPIGPTRWVPLNSTRGASNSARCPAPPTRCSCASIPTGRSRRSPS